MLLKVCGMTCENQINYLDKKGIAEMIGMIFFSGSPRCISTIVDKPCHAKAVGVFVNASFDEIMHKVITYQLDYVQLHGNESPELCSALKQNVKVIKAFRLKDHMDNSIMDPYENVCDLFLFDTLAETYGGSGKKFNWEILFSYDGNTPFILSGGIGPESTHDLTLLDHPKLIGIDINSCFETEPGIKDLNKIENFKNKLNNENAFFTR
jgi:phosphoribosylanthranilate isomerase